MSAGVTDEVRPSVATDFLTVEGGHLLRAGEHSIEGFKHSFVTVFAAAAISSGRATIANCPDIAETRALSSLVERLGATVSRVGSTLSLDMSNFDVASFDPAWLDEVHGATYLLPALLSRGARVPVSSNGGCQIGAGATGARPTAQYVSVLKRFGADISFDDYGNAWASVASARGCDIDLLDYTAERDLKSGPSYSGATKMALLMAAVSEGRSVLENIYPKPDVLDLVTMLGLLGVDVEFKEFGTVVVEGRGASTPWREGNHELIPDLIEIVTWITAGALLAETELRVAFSQGEYVRTALRPEFQILDDLGIGLTHTESGLTVSKTDRIRPADVRIHSHGAYSDSQPFFALLMGHADGVSSIRECVWAQRFGYAEGLSVMGMRMNELSSELTVSGCFPPRIEDSIVHGSDLRASAVLLIAALEVPGQTKIFGTRHLERGYADLPGAFRSLGGRVA